MNKLIAFLALLLVAASVHAQIPITIQNPSFETSGTLGSSKTCTDGSISKWNAGPVPSWVATGSNSFGTLIPCSDIYTAIPDGTAILYTNGPALTQDLGVQVVAGSTYTLIAYVGHRLNGNIAQSSTVSLLVGPTVVCSTTIQLSTITPGTFSPVSCSYTAPAQAGDLTISLSTTGAQSNFDNVSLTYVPVTTPTITVNAKVNYTDGTVPPISVVVNQVVTNTDGTVTATPVLQLTPDSSGSASGSFPKDTTVGYQVLAYFSQVLFFTDTFPAGTILVVQPQLTSVTASAVLNLDGTVKSSSFVTQ